jgi:hypothetical protein
MKPSMLEALVWVLIYGGLLMLVVGLALTRAETEWAGPLIGVGGGLAAAGVILIWVRSRMGR